MRNNPYILILFILMTRLAVNAQSNDPSLFGSGGGMTVVNDRYLSYSIGEPLISEVFSTGQWVTEGFQQPDAIDLTVSINTVDGRYVLDIFPNPASSSLFIKGYPLPACYVQIIDIAGRVVLSGSINPGEVNELRLTSISSGLYYLHFIYQQATLASTPFIKI
jgi:hypothetical protein